MFFQEKQLLQIALVRGIRAMILAQIPLPLRPKKLVSYLHLILSRIAN